MMLFSKAQGRSVVDVRSAETFGRVVACSVAPSPPRISAVRLKARHGHKAYAVTWRNIQSFGRDAVTVRSAEDLLPEDEIDSLAKEHESHEPFAKPVLSENGEWLGTVKDVEFDEEDGRLCALITEDGRLPGDCVLGVGSYAAVVRQP
ncbi:PRC-barrel domain-containing protein [Streptomyces sp. NPDC059176]|uniref:PRC-barrel domain-containing protein n=1 Tax=unclassified Streptomyces TaxID=2593676 RepID=UPI0036A29455